MDAVNACPWCGELVVLLVRSELVSLVHSDPQCDDWHGFVGALADIFHADPAAEPAWVDSPRAGRRG